MSKARRFLAVLCTVTMLFGNVAPTGNPVFASGASQDNVALDDAVLLESNIEEGSAEQAAEESTAPAEQPEAVKEVPAADDQPAETVQGIEPAASAAGEVTVLQEAPVEVIPAELPAEEQAGASAPAAAPEAAGEVEAQPASAEETLPAAEPAATAEEAFVEAEPAASVIVEISPDGEADRTVLQDRNAVVAVQVPAGTNFGLFATAPSRFRLAIRTGDTNLETTDATLPEGKTFFTYGILLEAGEYLISLESGSEVEVRVLKENDYNALVNSPAPEQQKPTEISDNQEAAVPEEKGETEVVPSNNNVNITTETIPEEKAPAETAQDASQPEDWEEEAVAILTTEQEEETAEIIPEEVEKVVITEEARATEQEQAVETIPEDAEKAATTDEAQAIEQEETPEVIPTETEIEVNAEKPLENEQEAREEQAEEAVKEETTEAAKEEKQEETEAEPIEEAAEAEAEKKETAEAEEESSEEAVETEAEPEEKETVEAEAAETTEEPEEVQEEEPALFEGTLTKQGYDFTVTAVITKDAGFPADVTLRVREVFPGTAEYKNYLGLTDEELSKDWNEVGDFARILDISFWSGDVEVQPQAYIDVQVTFHEAISVDEESDLKTFHFGANGTEEMSSQTSSEGAAKHDDSAVDSVSFSTNSFSVYVFVKSSVTKTKTISANGKTYEISVTYSKDAKIPDTAEVKVSEITESNPDYEYYRMQAAAALKSDDVILPGLYDISLYDGQTKIEPADPVQVSIRLADAAAVNSEEELHIVHFPDGIEAAKSAEVITQQIPASPEATEDAPQENKSQAQVVNMEVIQPTVEGQTVTFDAQSFSVYALAYTVDFHYDGKDYSIEGNSQILLSDLISILGVGSADMEGVQDIGNTIDINDVEEVIFTDEHLVTVEKVSGLIKYNNGEEIVEKDVGEKDFLLTSLEPFTSDEKLTIRMTDGSEIVIGVTDDQGAPLENVALPITITVSPNTDIDRSETLKISIKYEINGTDGKTVTNAIVNVPWTYDLSPWCGDSKVFSNIIDVRDGVLMSGDDEIGAYTISNNKITITPTATYLERIKNETEVHGTIDIDVVLNTIHNYNLDEDKFTFPGATEQTITYIKKDLKTVKTAGPATGSETYDGSNDNKAFNVVELTDSNGQKYYKIFWKIAFTPSTVPATLTLTDKFEDSAGNESDMLLVPGSIVLTDRWGNQINPNTGLRYTEDNDLKGFTVNVKEILANYGGGQEILAGQKYYVTYATTITADALNNDQTNTATFTYDGKDFPVTTTVTPTLTPEIDSNKYASNDKHHYDDSTNVVVTKEGDRYILWYRVDAKANQAFTSFTLTDTYGSDHELDQSTIEFNFGDSSGTWYSYNNLVSANSISVDPDNHNFTIDVAKFMTDKGGIVAGTKYRVRYKTTIAAEKVNGAEETNPNKKVTNTATWSTEGKNETDTTNIYPKQGVESYGISKTRGTKSYWSSNDVKVTADMSGDTPYPPGAYGIPYSITVDGHNADGGRIDYSGMTVVDYIDAANVWFKMDDSRNYILPDFEVYYSRERGSSEYPWADVVKNKHASPFTYTIEGPIAKSGTGFDGAEGDQCYRITFTFPSDDVSKQYYTTKTYDGSTSMPGYGCYQFRYTINLKNQNADDTTIGWRRVRNTAYFEGHHADEDLVVGYESPTLQKDFMGWDIDNNTAEWRVRVTVPEGKKLVNAVVWDNVHHGIKNDDGNAIIMDILSNNVTVYKAGTREAATDTYTVSLDDNGHLKVSFPNLTENIDIILKTRSNEELSEIRKYYAYNKVQLNSHNLMGSTLYDDADATYYRQDFDFNKNGNFDKDTQEATWVVEINSNNTILQPDVVPVFYDILPTGMEMTGKMTIKVTPKQNTNASGNVVDEWTINDYDYSSLINGLEIGPIDLAAAFRQDMGKNPNHYRVDYAPSGISGMHYTITYKTKVTDNHLLTMTPDNTYTFRNQASLYDNGGNKLKTDSDTVTYIFENLLKKTDMSDTDVQLLRYKVDINSRGQNINSGNPLILYDKVTTDMTLRLDSIKIYTVTGSGDNEILEDITTEKDNQGVNLCNIAYDDDTRVLEVYVPDGKHIRITYSATPREGNVLHPYVNTVTLKGVRFTQTDTVSKEHVVKTSGTLASSTNFIKLTKVDKYNVSQKLKNAEFQLYEGTLTNNEVTGNFLHTYNTGDSGELTFPGIIPGKLYYWVETVAPEGYILDQTPHYFIMYQELKGTDDMVTVKYSSLSDDTKAALKATFQDRAAALDALGQNDTIYVANRAPLATETSEARKQSFYLLNYKTPQNTSYETLADEVNYINRQIVYQLDDGIQAQANVTVASIPDGYNWQYTNVKTEVTKANLTAQKKMIGRNISAGEFGFELYDAANLNMPLQIKPSAAATDGATQTINFSAITYVVPGTYNYVIKETKGKNNAVIYDETVYHVKVVVTREVADPQTGETALVASTPVYTRDGLTVTNALFTNRKNDASITVNKTIIDAPQGLDTSTLKFDVTDITDEATPVAVGTITYAQILAGENTLRGNGIIEGNKYQIVESGVDVSGYTRTTTYTINAGVDHTGETAKLTLQNKASVVEFTNKYEPTVVELLVGKQWMAGDEIVSAPDSVTPVYFNLYKRIAGQTAWTLVNEAGQPYTLKAPGWLKRFTGIEDAEYKVVECKANGTEFTDAAQLGLISYFVGESAAALTEVTENNVANGTNNVLFIRNRLAKLNVYKFWLDENGQVKNPSTQSDVGVKNVTVKLQRSVDATNWEDVPGSEQTIWGSRHNDTSYGGTNDLWNVGKTYILPIFSNNGERYYYRSVETKIVLNDDTELNGEAVILEHYSTSQRLAEDATAGEYIQLKPEHINGIDTNWIFNQPKDKSIRVTKVWAGTNSGDTLPSVTVKLYQWNTDGNCWMPGYGWNTDSQSRKTLDAEHEWTARFTDLNPSATYKVVEEPTIAGFSTEYAVEHSDGTSDTNNESLQAGDSVTVTNTKEKGITVRKVWIGNNTVESISVKLQHNWKNYINQNWEWQDVETVILSSDNNWTHSWDALTTKDDNGPYIYRVVEDNVPTGFNVRYSDNNGQVAANSGEIITITNTKQIEDTELAVYKVWEDENNSKRPESITVKLKRGVPVSDGVTVKLQTPLNEILTLRNVKDNSYLTIQFEWYWNGMTCTVGSQSVPVDSSNKRCTLYIDGNTTITVNDNSASVANTTIFAYDAVQLVFDDDLSYVTYGELAQIPPDEKQQDDCVEVILNESNHWFASWSNLPTDAGDGKQYYYFVEEVVPSGYTETYDGNTGKQTGLITITNTEGPSTGSLKLTKQVTVNGASTTSTLADGTHTFTIHRVADETSTANDKTVTITVENGVAVSATGGSFDAETKAVTVTDLETGDYVITELAPTNGTTLESISGGKSGTANMSARSVTVTVEAGKNGDEVPVTGAATFTNNKSVGSLKLKKLFKNFGVDDLNASGEYFFELQQVDDQNRSIGDPIYINLYISGDQIGDYRVMTKAAFERGNYKSYNSVNQTVDGVYFSRDKDNNGFVIIRNLPTGFYWLKELPNEYHKSAVAIQRGDNDQSVVDLVNSRVKIQVTEGSTAASSAIVTFTNDNDYGAIKLKKIVTVGGQSATNENSSLVDGAYLFTVTPLGSVTPDRYVWIVVENGAMLTYAIHYGSNNWSIKKDWRRSFVDGWAIVDNDNQHLLRPGDYVIQEQGTGYEYTIESDGKITIDETKPLNNISLKSITGGTVSNSNDSTTVTVATGEAEEATFTNDYTAGMLYLDKKVLVDYRSTTDQIADGTYSFTITKTDNTVTHTMAITISGGVPDSATVDGKSVEKQTHGFPITLPVGTYTITETMPETETVPPGYSMSLVNISAKNYSDNHNMTGTDATGTSRDMANRRATVQVTADNTNTNQLVVAFTNNLQNDTPTVKKTVWDRNDSEDDQDIYRVSEKTFNDSADHDIGDSIPYRVLVQIPKSYKTGSYQFSISDSMQNLTFQPTTAKIYFSVYHTDTGSTDYYDVTNSFAISGTNPVTVTPSGNRSLTDVWRSDSGYKVNSNPHEVAFPHESLIRDTQAYVFKDHPMDELTAIEFRYLAILESGANIGSTGNENTVTVRGGNAPEVTDKNRVFTYALKVEKEDDNKNPLAGATFRLYKYYTHYHGSVEGYVQHNVGGYTGMYAKSGEAGGTSLTSNAQNVWVQIGNIQSGTGDKENIFQWNGIDDGHYLLEEVNIPSGYSTVVNPLEIHITAKHQPDSEDPKLTALSISTPGTNEITISGNMEEKVAGITTDGILSVKVPNKETMDITVRKEWAGAADPNDTQTKYVAYEISRSIDNVQDSDFNKLDKNPLHTVVISKNGGEYDGVSGTHIRLADNGNSWNYTWEDLPKYGTIGTTTDEYTYTVKEVQFGYGYYHITVNPDRTLSITDKDENTEDPQDLWTVNTVRDEDHNITTITNTLASVDIEVNKAWAPENDWPDNVESVTVKLQESVWEDPENDNSEEEAGYATPRDISGKTLTLTPAKQTVTFDNLPKYDDTYGKEIKYSVVETEITPVSGKTVNLSDFAVTYSPENTTTGGQITITNTALGSLKLKKVVKLNGGDNGDSTLTNGTYTFNIAKSSDSTTTIHTVTITYAGGAVTEAMIDSEAATPDANGFVTIAKLLEGDYVITESTPTNGTVLTGIEGGKTGTVDTATRSVTVHVTTGDKAAANTDAQTTFTNDYQTISIPVTKVWTKDGAHNWPEGVTVTVGLYVGDTAVKDPADTTANYTIVLSEDTDENDETDTTSGVFAGVPKYDAYGAVINYTVKEVGATTADGKTTITLQTGANNADEVWTVLITGNATDGYQVENTQDANKIFVQKRWYNAYGGYESTVNVPVNVTLHKVGEDTWTRTATITPPAAAVFDVEDDASQYYVEETSTFTGFETRYTTELLNSSLITEGQNIRLAGKTAANEVTVGKGGTLYVMNTPGLSGAQTAAHKKWVVFNDPNGQFYLGQLDGADLNADTWYQNNMQIDIELHYRATEVGNSSNTWTGIAANDCAPKNANHPERIRVWFGTSTHPAPSHIALTNTMVAAHGNTADFYMVFTGTESGSTQSDWKWELKENTGSGQHGTGTAGMLPAYGYINDNGGTHLVQYEYWFEEVRVYDGSTHGAYDWNTPEDVTAKWWKIEGTNGDLTNIENRPRNLPVKKDWRDENGNELSSEQIATMLDLLKVESITVNLLATVDSDQNNARWWVYKTLTLNADNNWKGVFTGLEYHVDGRTVSFKNGTTGTVTGDVKFKVEETWDDEYQRAGLYKYTDPADEPFTGVKIRNKLLPKGSIKVQKHWIVEDSEAESVLLKLYRVVNNAVTEVVLSTTDVTGGTIITEGEQSYIKITKTENTWPELTINNLLKKVSVQGNGQDQVYDAQYYVEEVGYQESGNNEILAIPDTWTAPVYSGGTGSGSYSGGTRYVTAPEPTVTEGHELIITNSLKPGSLQIIKAVPEGVDATEQLFTFQVVMTPMTGVTIDPTALSVDNGTKGTVTPETPAAGNAVTMIVTISGENTATITGIPAGTTYEVTEPPETLPTGWYQVGEVEYSDEHKTIAANETTDTVTITNTKGISINVTKKWTKDGVNKVFNEATSVGFTLHQVLTADGKESVDRIYTPYGSNGVGTVTYAPGSGWSIENIQNLPMVVTETEGEGTTVSYNASYYVVETSVTGDAGYVLTTEYSNETGAANPSATASEKTLSSGGTITIINTETAGVELPATGGPGTAIYTVAGLMLITLAGVLMISRKRKYSR